MSYDYTTAVQCSRIAWCEGTCYDDNRATVYACMVQSVTGPQWCRQSAHEIPSAFRRQWPDLSLADESTWQDFLQFNLPTRNSIAPITHAVNHWFIARSFKYAGTPKRNEMSPDNLHWWVVVWMRHFSRLPWSGHFSFYVVEICRPIKCFFLFSLQNKTRLGDRLMRNGFDEIMPALREYESKCL